MKFKGEHKDVVLRGIELAGSDRAVAAGGMNEMIGLVERDGMWEPYGFEKKIERILPSGRSKIMVHKTSAGDNVLCLFRNDNTYHGALKWVTKDNFLNPNVTLLWQDTGLTGVEEIAMVGNMITDQNLNSVLFANGEYSAFIVKPSPLELPNVDLRVTCDHQFTNNGKPDVSGSGNCIFAWQEMDLIDQKDSLSMDGVALAKRKEMAISLATKVLGQWAAKGGLTGYAMAAVAYKLTNGEYILAAPPQLLGSPYVRYKGGTLNIKDVSTGELTPTDPPKNIYAQATNLVIIPGNISDEVGATSRVYEFINGEYTAGDVSNVDRGYEFNAEDYGYISENINLIEDNCHILNGYVNKDNTIYAEPAITGLFERYKQVRSANEDINKYRCVVTCRANALEYKINDDIDERFAPSIDGVCIFLSKQVYGYDLTQDGIVSSIVGDSRVKDSAGYWKWGYMQGLYPMPKSEEDIIDELKKCDIFYKVKEIPFDEIKESDGWIYVDLEGKLGDALLTQPHLPPSTFSNAEMSSGKLFTYNNRIHMFDYMQTPSKMIDIRPYWYWGGYGQWVRSYISSAHQHGGAMATWRVIAKCKNSEHGEYVLDSGTTDGTNIRVKWFGGLICYPNPDCYEMEIRFAMNNTVYRKIFAMTKWENVGVAAYWNPDLEPWEWADWDHTWTQENPQPSMVVDTTTNPHAYRRHLRVSDVAYPYFPASQTEIIGRSRIIGLAHLSVPLSQDAYGKTPLLVFCDDGIYTLGVDVTGAKAYDTKTPLVPEVCVARRSICSLGFAVLFASRRGLMICTEKGVEEFTPKLRGKLKHLPKSNGTLGTGLQYYYNAVNEPLLMHDGAGAIDGYSFDDFVQSENMETTYLATKNAIILYIKSYRHPYCYMVDVETRVVTKLPRLIVMDDNNYPEQLFYTEDYDGSNMHAAVWSAGLYSGEDYTQCLFQTRPLYLGGILRRSFRFLLRGHFYGANPETGQQPHRAGLYILGSLDGEHWKLMGAKEKNLSMEGFHDFGCETYRDEVAYLMVIFTGYLHKSSHIDKMEVDGMFN